MFSFLDCFDRITGEILTLKIIEKNPGDEHRKDQHSDRP